MQSESPALGNGRCRLAPGLQQLADLRLLLPSCLQMKHDLLRNNIGGVWLAKNPADGADRFIRRMLPADCFEGQHHFGGARQGILSVLHQGRARMVGFSYNCDFFTVNAGDSGHHAYRNIPLQQPPPLLDMNLQECRQLLRPAPRPFEMNGVAAGQTQRFGEQLSLAAPYTGQIFAAELARDRPAAEGGQAERIRFLRAEGDQLQRMAGYNIMLR
ncbi:hypothetical protein D3C73_1154970 [compost metagenome]